MPVSVWSLFQALFAVFGIVLQWTLLGGFAGFTLAAFFWMGAIRPRLKRPQQERIMLFGGVVALSLLWGILAGFSVGLTRAYGVALERNETLRACATTLSTGVADCLYLAAHGDARLEEWRGGTLRVRPREALERVSRSGAAFEEQVAQSVKELPADAAGEFLLSSLPVRGRDVTQWCDWVTVALGASVGQEFTRAEMAEVLRDRILADAFSSALNKKLLKWQMWCLTLLVVGYAGAFLFACGPRGHAEFVFVIGGLLLLTACSPDVSDSGDGSEAPAKAVSESSKPTHGKPSSGRSSASRKSPRLSPGSRISETSDGVFHPPRVDGWYREGRENAAESSTSGTMPPRPAPSKTTIVSSSTIWRTYRWRTITTTWTQTSRNRFSNGPGSGSSTVYGLVPPTELISIVSSATSTVSSTIQEFSPGALCSVYRVRRRPADLDSILKMLDAEAEMIVQEYDVSACDFDGRRFSQHEGNLFVWEGVFMARWAGKYTFCLADRKNFVCFTIGGVTSLGNFTGETNSFTVRLAKGPNNIQVIVMFYDDNRERGAGTGRVAPFFTYRPPVSDGGFKFDDDDEDDELMNKITPAILYHAVEDGEEDS